MRTRAGSIVLATSLGLGGLATGIVVAPAMATAATSETSAATAMGDRVTKIKAALAGLVTDKTLTQAQADKVATTLAEKVPEGRGQGRGQGPDGRGGPGHGKRGGHPALDVAATAIGITEAELRTQLKAGKTLAQVAEAKGVSKAALISKLVAAAEKRIATAVSEGKLTQAEADAKKAGLQARITEQVDRVHPGRGHQGGHPQDGATGPSTTTPSTTTPSTTTPSTTSSSST